MADPLHDDRASPDASAESYLHSDQVREAITSFHRSWEKNHPQRIEELLAGAPPAAHGPLLVELLGIELAERRKRGETPELREYVARFPAFELLLHTFFATEHDSHSVANTATVSSPARRSPPPGDAVYPSASEPEGVERYQLLNLLGVGGFAQVWRAHDTFLDRIVAVKLLRPDRTPPQSACDALLGEARRQGRLNVAGVVPVYDLTESSGTFLIVTKYIEGETLAARIKRERVPPSEAARIVAEVARTLHQAHLQNVVHRDIKPSNILLDREGRTWVADFGVAGTEEELQQESSDIVGTHAYMSPEQARGDSHLVDARADIYSLGVVLYELLSGRRPFLATNSAKLLEEVIKKPPRPPRTIDENIPVALEQLCLSCLAKSSEDRFSTTADLADALAHWLLHNEATSSNVNVARAAARNYSLLAGLALAALAAAGLWSGYAWVFSPRVSDGESTPKLVVPRQTTQPRREQTPERTSDAPIFTGDWMPLLNHEPKLVVRHPNLMPEGPRYIADAQEYWVRSDHARWLAQLGELPSVPVEIRAGVRVDQWEGIAGIVWGFHPDAEVFPNKRFTCYVAEFSKTNSSQPAKLVVQQFALEPSSFDVLEIVDKAIITSTDISIPRIPQEQFTRLHLALTPDWVSIVFGAEQPIIVRHADHPGKWLSPTVKVGIMGQGREVVFRDLSVRYSR